MIRPINCTSIKSFKQAQMPQQTEFEQQPQAQEFVDYAQWQKENKKPSKDGLNIK